jgi:hypothetical protein
MAAGWHALARPQIAAQNRCPEAFIDLPVQRPRRAVNGNNGRDPFRSLSHEVKDSGYMKIGASGYYADHFAG